MASAVLLLPFPRAGCNDTACGGGVLDRPSLYGGSSSPSAGMLEDVLMVVVLVEEWSEEVGLVVGLLGLWLR